MKRELESIIMEQLKKGYCPVYVGEEGYIIITMKAYLAAAEYAGAEDICFWYDELYYGMTDLETKEVKIGAEYFNFMPRKIESDICPNPEGRSDEIFSDLEDVNDRCMLITERIRALAGDLYELRWDMALRPEIDGNIQDTVAEIDGNIQDIVSEMGRYEKMLSRIIAYIRAKLEVKKE